MKKLINKVAFITGAAGGIGRSIALALAQQGCHVVVTDLSQEAAEKTRQQAKKFGVDALALQLDVADEASFNIAANTAIAWKGRVDILINNAGIMLGGAVAETSLAQFKKITEVNVYGAVHGCKAFEPHMRSNGEGHIVNVASLFGLMHLPFVSAYCMSKAASIAFSNSLRAELSPHNIGVSCVCPGSVETSLIKDGQWADSKGGGFIPDMFNQNYKSTPEHIADCVIKGIKKNQGQVFAGRDARILAPLIRWMPAVFQASFTRVAKKMA